MGDTDDLLLSISIERVLLSVSTANQHHICYKILKIIVLAPNTIVGVAIDYQIADQFSTRMNNFTGFWINDL